MAISRRAVAAVSGFVGRVGGALIAPRATLRQLGAGGRGGLRDLLWLVLLQLIVTQLPRLVAAVLQMIGASYSVGITALLNTAAQAFLAPVVMVLLAAVVAGWLTRRAAARGRLLDLVALCAIPPVILQLALSLVLALGRWSPPRWLAQAVVAASLLWFAILVVVAVAVIRGGGDGEARA